MGSSEATVEDSFGEIVAARRDLLQVLEQLDPADWDKPTLCEGWRVRDVVSHLSQLPKMKLRSVVAGMIRARGNVDRMLDEHARAAGSREPEEILATFRESIDSRRIPPGGDADKVLTDTVVHSLDICHPNGWELALPADRARHVLSTLVTLSDPFRGKQRAAGLHLDTTDIDWRCGCGGNVRGPASLMLLALAGRPVCDQLVGDGVAELADRG